MYASGGQNIQTKRCDDADLHTICRAYAVAAAAEGWRGPLNVQLKRTPDGKLVAHELNGRFGGGTAARVHLGLDEMGEVMAPFLPKMTFPAIAASVSDVVQRYLASYPIPRDA